MYIYNGSKNRRSGTMMQKLPYRGGLSRAERVREVLPGYPVDNPFESEVEVIEYLSHAKITCLLCGKEYANLGTHVMRIHEIDADQYRRRFGIPSARGLIGADYLAVKKATSIFSLEPGKYSGCGRYDRTLSRPQYVVPYKREQLNAMLRGNAKRANAMSVSRTTKVTTVTVGKVCNAILAGSSLETACNCTGEITFSGFKKVLRQKPEFRALITAAMTERGKIKPIGRPPNRKGATV